MKSRNIQNHTFDCIESTLIKNIVLVIIILFSQYSYSQSTFDNYSGLYKIVCVDSMPSHYLIFVSRNINDSILLPKPHLIKIDECGSYKIEFFENQSLYCIISNRNDSLRRNINIGLTYNLSLDTNFYSTIQNVNSHLGFGDYLMQEPWMKVCTSNEIVSLYYTQEIDSINKLRLLYSQNLFFDYSMLNIWLNLDKLNKDCYFKWLKTMIRNSDRIKVKCKDKCLELFDDPDCSMLRVKINCSTECSDGMTEAKLIFHYRRNGFIEINDAGNVLYGWIRKPQLR